MVPRTSHGAWTPAPDRPDPLALLRAQDDDRMADLVPIRWGRMSSLAVCLLPRFGGAHGGRPGSAAAHRPHRAALRRRPPLELRPVRLARARAALRRQRLRRDAARAVRVGPEAPGGELRPGEPQQRLGRGRGPRDRPGRRALLPRAHDGLRRDARARRLVLAHRRRRAARHGARQPGRQGGHQEGPSTGGSRSRRRPSPRRAAATACRRPASSPRSSTARGASSTSRRSSCT